MEQTRDPEVAHHVHPSARLDKQVLITEYLVLNLDQLQPLGRGVRQMRCQQPARWPADTARISL